MKNFLSITVRLIILNIVIFLIFGVTSLFTSEEILLEIFALKPANIFSNFYVWTLLTSMFLHANFFHLFVNMFSLFFIGGLLEKIIGRKRFFWLYIISGIFAAFFFSLLSFFLGNFGIGERIFGNPNTFAVGASGALFAVLGVLAVLTPKNKIYLIAGPLIALILQAFISKLYPPAENISSLLIGFYILFSIFALLSFSARISRIALPLEMPLWFLPIIAIVPLVVIGLFVELPIGNIAHLGGLIAGLAYGFYLTRKYPNKTKMLRRYFSR